MALLAISSPAHGVATVAIMITPHVIESLPAWVYRRLKRTYDKLRVLLFTKQVDERDIVVEAHVSLDELRDLLGDAYFTNGWELSYNYKDEDMNMRRPLRKDDTYEWYQTHVRGWRQDDGPTKLEIHEDLEPTEHPYYHLHPPDDANLSENEAIYDVAAILDDAEIDYKILDRNA